MAIVSFGSGPAGGPTSFGTGRGQHATRYVNTTGGYVTLTQLETYLSGVPSSGSYTYQLAIYNDFPGYPWPYQYLGETVTTTRAAIYPGATNIPVTVTLAMTGDPVVVRPGEAVWLVFQASQGGSFFVTGGVGVRAQSTLDTDYSPGSWPPYFLADPALVNNYIPIVAYGDDTAPVAVSNLRDVLTVAEPLTGGDPDLQINYVFNEAASEGYPTLAVNMAFMESLHPVQPELPMSTEPFPGFGNSTTNPAIPQALDPFDSALPGLSFSVHKKPSFKTKISESPAGNEVRNALQTYPRWEFTLPYEFLEDRSGAESSLKTIMGFFLARQGSFDSWLFKDPDDYLVVNGTCGITDGLTTQYPFCRTMGSFQEKVGQVDTANTITVYLSVEEPGTIPATPGPYTITVAEAASFTADIGVTKGGVPMTKVTGAPAAGEYAVDEMTGIYTFNATDQADDVVINYRYEVDPVAYTVTLPNLIVFDSAPAADQILTADFQFFFACRFLEDQMDFEKFMDKLWNLQECNFRSIIQ